MHKSIASVSLFALLAVSAAQAAPTAITACGTISQSGSYELARNLSAMGDCLVITADNVTIDLGGFTISGSFSIPATGTGILAATGSLGTSGGASITVRRGTVTGFLNAVDLSLASGVSIVEGLRVDTPFLSNVGTGINAQGIVKDNVVSAGSAAVAINAGGKVTGNVVAVSFGTGMLVSSGSTVIGNTVRAARRGLVVACLSTPERNCIVGRSENTSQTQLEG